MNSYDDVNRYLVEADFNSAFDSLELYLTNVAPKFLNELVGLKMNYKQSCNDQKFQRVSREIFRMECAQLSESILFLLNKAKGESSETNVESEASVDSCWKKDVTIKITIKILLLAANPFATNPLLLSEEIRKIQTNIKRARERDVLVFKPALAVTRDTLMQEMHDEHPDIVQFSGHGDADGIYLEQEDGKPLFIKTSALEALFKYFNKVSNVRCVLLNCCYSEKQAETISAHIHYVIGTTSSILDRAAIIFSAGFYQAVGAGENIQSAFEAGKVCLKLEGYEENHPVLWINGKIAS